MWYNLNINRLTELLTPSFLRKEKFLAWLRALHFPLIKVLDDFNFNRNENLYNLAHNGQVCYLRAVLNDRFDPTERRIKIVDGVQYKRLWIYDAAYNRPSLLGNKYINEINAYQDNGYDFLVLVPGELYYSLDVLRLRKIVDFYKMASRRYKIVLTS